MFILHHSVTVASESGIYYVHGGSHTHMCLVQEADGVIIRMDGASMERHSHVIGSKKEVDKKTCAQGSNSVSPRFETTLISFSMIKILSVNKNLWVQK